VAIILGEVKKEQLKLRRIKRVKTLNEKIDIIFCYFGIIKTQIIECLHFKISARRCWG
jgi:hypothetical protein